VTTSGSRITVEPIIQVAVRAILFLTLSLSGKSIRNDESAIAPIKNTIAKKFPTVFVLGNGTTISASSADTKTRRYAMALRGTFVNIPVIVSGIWPSVMFDRYPG
jgi:hypothetical protein